MEEEDNMTWTMPWATADVPVASSSAVPPPPNPQQTATSAANSIPKKKSVRRSSILKTTTAATAQVDKRGPLKDVGNGRGETADDMGIGGGATEGLKPPPSTKLSAKRRSSLGRRVSFSATTKVKEFEPTNLGGTVWNSTYEASEISTRQQASQQAMEMTGTMDMTCHQGAKENCAPAGAADPFAALFASTAMREQTEAAASAASCEEPGKAVEPIEGMDMTCKVSFGVRPDQENNPKMVDETLAMMDMTCKPDKVPVNPSGDELEVTRGMDITCKPDKTQIHSGLNEPEVTRGMDITCKPDKTQIHSGPNEPEVTRGMDITCKSISKHQVLPCRDEPEVTEARMDITCKPDKVSFHPSQDEVEVTRGMDITCKPEKVRFHPVSDEPEVTRGMDITCKPDKVHPTRDEPEITEGMNIPCKPDKSQIQTKKDQPEVTERMDMTCKPENVQFQLSQDQPEVTAKMDITCKPDKPQIQPRGDDPEVTERMDMTCKPISKTQPIPSRDEPEMAEQMDRLTCGASENIVAEPEATERVDLTCKPDKNIFMKRPDSTDKVEPERTERMEMTSKVPDKMISRQDTVDSKKVQIAENIEPTENQVVSESFVPTIILTDATDTVKNDIKMDLTFKVPDGSKPVQEVGTESHQQVERMDLTFKLPGSSSQQQQQPLSTTFTVETKFDDPVTPIRPLQRKGFVEDADTMAFSASMLSSTRIMNSTAFSPGGLVSITYDDDEVPPTSPKVVQKTMSPQQKAVTPVRKVVAAAPHPVNSPLTLPRTEAELKLDMLLNELKTDVPSSQYLMGPRRGEDAQVITERIQGMFSDVHFTQVDEEFKLQPLEVRKRSHDDEGVAEGEGVTTAKKKKGPAAEADQKKAVERVSAFEHLHAKHTQTDVLDYYDRHQGAWTLTENHGNYACIAFMQGSLHLNMVVGHRLNGEELKSNGKTILVQHYNIQSLELRSKVGSGNDNVVRLAHHLLLAALTPTKLGEMCPNTRALEKTLRYLMLKVHEASMLVVDLDRIDNTHCYFKVSDDFRVTVKFYSIKCGFSFKTTLSMKDGFGPCREKGVEYERGPSNNSLMGKDVVQTLYKRTDVGWKMMTKFVDKIDAYIAQLEKDM